jgi:S-adenosylmethionine synthetase
MIERELVLMTIKKGYYLFTSESVTEGHPDKLCDQISDSILDAIYEKDPYARVACECCVGRGFVLVTGEISANTHIDYQKIVRNTISNIGYTSAEFGFDAQT